LNNRAKALSKEIKKRIIYQEIDKSMDAEISDDSDNSETNN
jgi:hypothetical protein